MSRESYKSRETRVLFPWYFFLVFLLLLGLSGCFFWDSSVKVGVVGAFSGTHGDLGTGGRNGFQMVFPSSRLKYGIEGKKVEVLYRDDRADPDTALEIYKDLKSQGCRIIVSFQTSGSAGKAFDYADSQGLLVVSATASSTDWEGLDDYIIRIMAATSQQGAALARRAVAEGRKKAFSLGSAQNLAYSRSVAEGFSAPFTAAGGEIVGSLDLPGARDWDLSEVARAIKESGADCLAPLSLNSAETATLALQLEKLGIRKPVYLSAWSLSGDPTALAGTAMEGYAAVSLMNHFSPVPNYRKFREAYRSVYSSEPQFPALLGYEAGQMVDYLLSHTRELSAAGMKKSLLEKKIFEGLQVPIELDAQGDFHRPLFLYRFTSGRWEIIRS